jgi:hypothetical protein
MKYKKGQSGNPAGRPKGTSKANKLRRAIANDLEHIISAMVAAAREGDVSAAKLLLDRVIPALKPMDIPVALPLGEGLAESGQVILSAIGAGRLTPDQGAKLLQGLGAAARVEEVAELKDRLESIERVLQSRGSRNE